MTKQSNPAQGQEQTTPKTVSIMDLPFVKDEKAKGGKSRRNFWSVPKAEIYGHACNAEHIRQARIARLESTPLAFEFNGKRQSFLSLRELSDRIELHTNYYNNLVAGKALGRSDLEADIDQMAQWLTLANGLLNNIQCKLDNGIYKGLHYE
jgi:hypothetical protein